MDTPVLVTAFNRPDKLSRLLEALRAVRPRRLFVSFDGPRPGRDGERESVERCKDLLATSIDWEADVETRALDDNVGCRLAMSSAIDWFFAQVHEGIVLEDDCIPDPTYFAFAGQLLERYRHDRRIMSISGTNVGVSRSRASDTYWFSRYPRVWGWATWATAWRHYDVSMKDWPAFRDAGMLAAYVDDPAAEEYWTHTFDAAHQGRIDTWDYAWVFACWRESGLHATPHSNLVTNIGFDATATHTTSPSPMANLPTESLGRIQHPRWVARDPRLDRLAEEREFRTRARGMRRLARVRSWARRNST